MADPFCGNAEGRPGCASYRLFLGRDYSVVSAMVTGALYGFAFSLVIYLAKAGPKSGDAPYVIPSGIITGGLTGLFILIWAAKKI
jgi:hypothetical protein